LLTFFRGEKIKIREVTTFRGVGYQFKASQSLIFVFKCICWDLVKRWSPAVPDKDP
jgi:hypothetical protein